MYFYSVIIFFSYSNFHCLQGFRMKKSPVLKPAPVRPAKVYQMSKHSKTFVLKSGNKTFRNLLLPAFDQSTGSFLCWTSLCCFVSCSGGVHHSHAGFNLHSHAIGTHMKQYMHVVQCLTVTAKPNMSYRCKWWNFNWEAVMEKCSTDRYHSSNMHLQNNNHFQPFSDKWSDFKMPGGDGAGSILHSKLLKSFTLFTLTRLSSLPWWLRTWNTQRPWLTNCQHCGGRESRIKLLHSEFWKWQPCCGRCYSAPQALCDLMLVRTCFWKI